MNPVEQKYANSISVAARKLMTEVDTESVENIALAAAAQGKYLDDLANILEAQRDQLVTELNRTVMEYSAQIAEANEWLSKIYNQTGRRELMKEQFEERSVE